MPKTAAPPSGRRVAKYVAPVILALVECSISWRRQRSLGHDVFGKGEPRTHLLCVVPLHGNA
jgi:hypothetical protein